jgi:DNA helicase-2/ATP-dependent DNA helicase PcrA
VLAGRIGHLVESRGVSPSTILAITFTTAAAATLRERLAGVFGTAARDLTITTFHALGLRIIKHWSQELGFGNATPAVYGSDDARTVLREVATEFGLAIAPESDRRNSDPWSLSLSKLVYALDRFRLGVGGEHRTFDESEKLDVELLGALASAYEALLRRRGAVDYPLMLTLPLSLFDTEPRALHLVQDAYRFVMVDEFQDTCVTQFKRRDFDGNLVQVTLRSGRVVRMTPDHMCFARLGLRRDVFCVYLMYKRDLGYRVGQTIGAIYSREVARFIPGVRVRANGEGADKAWILRVCSTMEEAAYYEQFFSLRYAVPRLVFHVPNKMVLDQAAIDHLFEAIDTRANAARLMSDLGLHFEYPHHRPQAHVAGPRTRRRQVHITLFGGKAGSLRHNWRWHRVWLNSTDKVTELSLQRRAVATRQGAQGTWRVERHVRDAEMALSLADEFAKFAESPEVAFWALLSDGHKFSFQPASQLHPTMIVPVLDGGKVVDDEIVSVERIHYRGRVYDLNVDKLHNYVANGMVVHNCIFGWRGANPHALRNFQQNYPEARVFALNQNYRSTGVIVALSNAVAAPLDTGRESWTSNAHGPQARVYVAGDELDEADFVAAQISELLASGQIDHPGEVAVLFRTNAQAQVVALTLRSAGVPFRVRRDADLFVHAEVRDVVAYLRLAHCPTDAPALARVLNVPPRKLRSIEQALRKRPVPVPELPGWAQKRGGPSARRAVEELLAMLDDLHQTTRECQPLGALETVLLQTGYLTWLASQEDARSKLDRLDELRSLIEGSSAPDLATWLVDMHLGDIDAPAPAGTQAVTLSTIHAAKGAEWPVVFLIGFEDGLLPRHAQVAGLSSDAEDAERRLAYVAVSRTQVLLYLVYSERRRVGSDARTSRLEPRRPSRFLVNLPPDLLQRVGQTRAA